jgi:hypothetical protein
MFPIQLYRFGHATKNERTQQSGRMIIAGARLANKIFRHFLLFLVAPQAASPGTPSPSLAGGSSSAIPVATPSWGSAFRALMKP